MNLGETADLICVADANPITSDMFTWTFLVSAAMCTKALPRLPLCDVGHSHCLSPAFQAAQVHHISPTVTILPPPPLPAPHSAQIQKNSFHYHSLAKGHICQCGVASVSTDAFSCRTHPLAVLCVSLSARSVLSFSSFPVVFQPLPLSFCPWSSTPFPYPPQALTLSCLNLPFRLPTLSSALDTPPPSQWMVC